MFCKNCGKEIADDSRICAYCGTQVAAPAAAPVAAAPAQEEKLGFNVLGLIGMICGILSLFKRTSNNDYCVKYSHPSSDTDMGYKSLDRATK